MWLHGMSNTRAPAGADTLGGCCQSWGKKSLQSGCHRGCQNLLQHEKQMYGIQIYLQKHLEQWCREPVQSFTSLHSAGSELLGVPGHFQNDPQPAWEEIFLFCTCLVMIPTLMSLRCSSSAQSRLYLQLFVWHVIKALAQVIGQCTIKDFATNYFKKESEHELMYTHTHRYTFT